MCTVTFLPRASGYCLGMNRDEQRARVKGWPPEAHSIYGRRVVFPSEPGGGTWIAVNDRGVSLTLINWYSAAGKARGNVQSRGAVIPALGAADSPALLDRGISRLPLKRINPFRLIAVFPAAREIIEWRWDVKKLTRKRHRWRARQWISSGFDEPTAQRTRSKTFREAWTQKSAGTIGWLRRLHRSHRPQIGPFSTCMHRADATTVSYSETTVRQGLAQMRYLDGSPCARLRTKPRVVELPLAGGTRHFPKARVGKKPIRPQVPHAGTRQGGGTRASN